MGINCPKLENKNTGSPSGIPFLVNKAASLDNLKSCPYSIYNIHPLTPPIAVCNPNNLNKNSVPSSKNRR
jgi:hypothetical protein